MHPLLLCLAGALPAIAIASSSNPLQPRDIPALTTLLTTLTDSLNNFTASYATSTTNTASLPPAFSSLLTTFTTSTEAVTTLSDSDTTPISALQVPSLADPALDLVAAGGLLVAALSADKQSITQQQGGCKTVHDGLEGLMGAAGRWNAALLGVLPQPEGGEVFGEGEGTLAGVVRGGVGEFGGGECAVATETGVVKPKETGVVGKGDEGKKNGVGRGRGSVGWGAVVGMGMLGVVGVGF